jgi:Domain of unknown function (DUF4399)
MFSRSPVAVLPVLLLAALAGSGYAAEALPLDPLERDCWLSHTRDRTRVHMKEPTTVGFGNLRDGALLQSPFRVDLSVRGMGVAPAGVAHPKSGHHHILINQTLPQRVGDTIPFDERHRHFGKGQTSSSLELPPGEHRLRLLFADHEHRPYFVFSPEIRVRVIDPPKPGQKPHIDPSRFASSCVVWHDHATSRPHPPGRRLMVGNVRDGEPVSSPFNLRFSVEGYGVAPRKVDRPGFGWFKLEIQPEGGGVSKWIELDNGATQTNLFLNNGRHRLRLHFLDSKGQALLPPVEWLMPVVKQDPLAGYG